MNFITFPAQATNLFPAANLTSGGQLVTEFNMRSREMVVTDPRIDYQVGPSFVHGTKDFEVSVLSDAGGALINGYTLSIAPGRAVINGHYVETLVPMTIDLVEANAALASQSRPILKGTLGIGIRTFYSTDETVAGSILVENEQDMLMGIQLVVLPLEEIITPSDSPTDQSRVTADVLLATFTYLNNKISAIKNLTSKMQYIPSERVRNLNEIVSSSYITKRGLNSKKLYAFAGKGTDPETGLDTWEDVTDSMIVWDVEPTRTQVPSPYREAQIVALPSGAYFVLPHKQVAGMSGDNGNAEYYAPKIIEIPSADYTTSSTGMVNKEYTAQIKDIADKVSQFRTSLTGKQIYFMESRAMDDETLPPINDLWQCGDYILVRSDYFYLGDSDSESAPSTMYVVLPGQVLTTQFVSSGDGDTFNDVPVPASISGVELGYQNWYEASGKPEPETVDPEFYPEFFSPSDHVRGIPGTTGDWVDYFRIRYYRQDVPDHGYTDYFYAVKTAGPREWSGAVLVTGSISLATEEIIGGFLNTSDDAIDYGYVRLDETGHLRLVDYNLLRSGTLAYQLGQDITLPSTDDLAEIQNNLNEYVNERVAFPSTMSHGALSPMIHVYIDIPESEEAAELEISGIDSRFNTAVCLHIQGNAGSNVAINISDCEKIMIDPDISGTPVINIFRCNLFYDSTVFEYIKNCERDPSIYGDFNGFRDLTIWYEKIDNEHPDLQVNGMTVSEINSAVIAADINYWREDGTAANDNDYLIALKSITFSGEGDIIGLEVLAANNSTDNIAQGEKIIVGEFVLPQGSSLVYPVACLTRKLKVTGNFTTAYYSDENWYVTNNSFSLETGVYTTEANPGTLLGTVAFHSTTTLIPSTIPQTSISVWEPDEYQIFRGGSIS